MAKNSNFPSNKNPLEALPPDLHVQIREDARKYCIHIHGTLCTNCLVKILVKYLDKAVSDDWNYARYIKDKGALAKAENRTFEGTENEKAEEEPAELDDDEWLG